MSRSLGSSGGDDEWAHIVRKNLLDDATFCNDLKAKSLADAFRTIISFLYRDSIEENHKDLILTRLLASEQVRSFDLGNGCCIPHLRLANKDSALTKVGWFRFSSPIVTSSGKHIRFIFFAVVPDKIATPLLSAAVNVILDQKFQELIEQKEQEYEYFVAAARSILNRVDHPKGSLRIVDEASGPSIRIVSRRGLHARLSAAITMMLDDLDCECTVSFGDYKVDARSIVGMMMLGAASGSDLKVSAKGGDSELALARVASLLSNGTM